MPTTPCLPRQTLKEYLSGWSDAESCDAIEAHLIQCAECEQTVVDLESRPDTLCELLSGADAANAEAGAPRPADAAVEYAIGKAKRLPIETAECNEKWQPPTSQFGPYELLRPLGHGGMGAVYLARHRQLGKQVAIKLLPSRTFRNDHYAARFQREIRAAGQLNHPAIVSATDAGQHDSTHFLVMEFIDGFDLSRTLRLTGPLRIADACAMMRTVALGLSYAHAEGIVHRDIKPSNLMLGSGGEVKILDFGLAQVSLWDEVSAELTTVGQLMGTLDYMAPEQAERADSVDYRADLYSLGATLFRLLCGRAPLAASPDLSPLAKLRLLGTFEPPRLDTLRADAPPELVQLMSRLLSRDPVERPPSAAHVAELLAPFADGADLATLVATAQSRAAERTETACVSHAQAELLPTAVIGSGSTPRWTRWLVAAAFLPLILLAGVLITLELQKGQLVIESNGASIDVNLLKDGEFYSKLKVEPGVNTTRLSAGRYEVILDAGSDGFTVDSEIIEITKGNTTIARVTLVAAGESPAAPSGLGQELDRSLPASDAKLQPGDRLLIRCLADPSLDNQNAIVLADRSVKLRLVGVVDVNDMDVLGLERHLNEQYAKFLREPQIEVFHELRAVSAPTNSNNDQLAGGFERSMTVASAPELMYQGKSLTEWLDQLERERSPTAIWETFTALNALVTPESSQRISRFILKTLPTLENMKIRLGATSPAMSLDSRAFPLLAKCQPNRLAYFELLTSELENAETSWARRILSDRTNFFFRQYDSGREYGSGEVSDFLPLLSWIEQHILESETRSDLLLDAARVFYELANGSELSLESKTRLVTMLTNCKALGESFWLANVPLVEPQSRGGNIYVPWNTGFAEAVERAACQVLADPECNPQHLARAAIVLNALNGPAYDRSGLTPTPLSIDSLKSQLDRVSETPAQLMQLMELMGEANTTSLDTVEALLGPVAGPLPNLQYSIHRKNSSEICLQEELINLIDNLGFDRLEFESELLRIVEVHRPQVMLLARAVVNPYSPLHVNLRWPELTPTSSHASATTPTEWLALMVMDAAYQKLSLEQQTKIREPIVLEVKYEWIGRLMERSDENIDGKLSIEESDAARLRTGIMDPDEDEDGFISQDELFRHYEQATQPRASAANSLGTTGYASIDWALRQIAKYDRNGDGVLVESEWKSMTIKPEGADADHDGRITASEYAQYRDKERK